MPEIAYADPLPGRAAVLAYRELERTCAEGLLLGDKRSVPGSLPSALRLGLRMLAQGTPAWGSLAGEDARALFTGVAAHVISRMPSMTAAGADAARTLLRSEFGINAMPALGAGVGA